MNRPVRVIVVDDEPLAREGLAAYLQADPEVDLVRMCADGVEAVNAIRNLDPDLVFLDIQMPEVSGFDVIEAVGVDEMPPVVFVTAYDEFALEAFEASALDYVLKPIDEERVARALHRARRWIAGDSGGQPAEAIERLLQRVTPTRGYLRKFAVRTENRTRFVDAADVAWLEASGNYVVLHESAGGDTRRTHRVRGTMASLENKLDPAEFIRIHRSKFVRVDAIREMEPLYQGDYLLILVDGTRLTSSRAYRDSVRDLLRGIR